MGFAEGTFGVIIGLKAHPDELKMELFDRKKHIPGAPDNSLYEKGSEIYPGPV